MIGVLQEIGVDVEALYWDYTPTKIKHVFWTYRGADIKKHEDTWFFKDKRLKSMYCYTSKDQIDSGHSLGT